MKNNVGTILVLFILLVIIVCSCGVLGRNERHEERNENRNEDRHEKKHDRNQNERGYNGGCNNVY